MKTTNHNLYHTLRRLPLLCLLLFLCLPVPVYAQKAEEGTVISEDLDAAQIASEAAGTLKKPVLVSAINGMDGAKLTWNTVSGCSGYIVMRKGTDGWKTLKTLTGRSVTTYVDSTGESGYTYTYSVRAWNDEGRSDFDREGRRLLYLTTPEISLSNIAAGLKVSWKAVPGAESYRIYHKNSDGSLNEIGTTKSTSFVDKEVSSGKTCRYAVRAVAGSTLSSYRSVQGQFLAAVTGSAKTENRGVKVTWTKVQGASRYLIYRRKGEGTSKYLGSACRGSWLDETVPSSGDYTYIIKSANGVTVSGLAKFEVKVTHAHSYVTSSQILPGKTTGGRRILKCSSCGYTRKIALAPEELGFYLFSDWAGILRTAQNNYEERVPGFTKKSRGPLDPIADIRTPMYLKDSDGIYTSVYSDTKAQAVLMMTGDLMCQRDQQTAAKATYGEYSFYDSFDYVAGIFDDADFVVGNLETCLSESASYMSEQYTVEDRFHCNAPSTYLDALRAAGFDMVVTANNHALDTGVKGLFQTLSHLDEYGLIHTGTFRKKSEPRYTIVEINGIKVGFLSYTTITNGLAANLTTAGQNALINLYSESKVKADVKAAKAAGAEYIIAWNHWGTEYQTTASATSKKYAQQMADAGVDYIVGSHPHALQQYDVLKAADGRQVPVMYSMGNFLSHQTRKCSKEAVILQITLKKNSRGKVVLSGEGYIPCRVQSTYQGHNYAILPLTQPYGSGLSVSSASSYYTDIKSIIGDKIPVLGTFG